MQNTTSWIMVSKHLGGEESASELQQFNSWLEESEENKALFTKLKNIWDNPVNTPVRLLDKYTWKGIKEILYRQTLGNLVGFIVGMWVTTLFSHHVLESRNLSNLFGLKGRKQVEVNDMPQWFQKGLAILVGFIALELINHFFQTKQHKKLYEFFLSRAAKTKG
ncbi:MAG: hypothetical protein M3R27_10630 [Bacteroidota bacterium]|nr:hypothetical protein [Bacteroidota bacterium]